MDQKLEPIIIQSADDTKIAVISNFLDDKMKEDLDKLKQAKQPDEIQQRQMQNSAFGQGKEIETRKLTKDMKDCHVEEVAELFRVCPGGRTMDAQQWDRYGIAKGLEKSFQIFKTKMGERGERIQETTDQSA